MLLIVCLDFSWQLSTEPTTQWQLLYSWYWYTPFTQSSILGKTHVCSCYKWIQRRVSKGSTWVVISTTAQLWIANLLKPHNFSLGDRINKINPVKLHNNHFRWQQNMGLKTSCLILQFSSEVCGRWTDRQTGKHTSIQYIKTFCSRWELILQEHKGYCYHPHLHFTALRAWKHSVHTHTGTHTLWLCDRLRKNKQGFSATSVTCAT